MTMALFLSVFLCFCTGALGFNVDIPSRVIHRGNQDSMFGFTVQAHIDGDRKMILVGAPEDNPPPPYQMEGVERPGAVYRCEPGQRGGVGERPLERCQVIAFDKSRGNTADKQQRQIDQKSKQWFGATLSSTGRNGPIVACAPRYVSFVTAKQGQRDPVGTCWVAKDSTARDEEVHEYSPCRTATHGQRKTGVCQAGFSAAIAKDGQRLFMGAPGSFYWQGQTYEYTMGRKPTIISTHEDSTTYDDSYMGYSMTVGDFAGEGIQGVAVGVPRAQGLHGLVVLYTWGLQNVKNISGTQIGEYFGYCLAAGDIDGDGTDDVIVGSPMYTKLKTDGYEHGRISVIYQGKNENYFNKAHTRTGEVSRGRFGLSVTSLGDMNNDGFGDIAVGAPYGGEHGRGVVYIYHGSDRGIREKYSQAITAEEIAPGLTTFGFSLSGGVDLDNNNYTDLAVGAYKSDAVVFLKARPVIKVMAEVQYDDASKLISMEKKSCRLANGTKVACTSLLFCLTYKGINVDQQINFIVTLELDSRKNTTKRMFMKGSRETTYTTRILLTQKKQQCQPLEVYLDNDIRDKLTPIEVKMTYKLATQHSGAAVPPVLDQTVSMERTDALNIQKDCGPDNVCTPDLRLSVTSPTINYVLGSSENIALDVSVQNYGEDAYEAAFYLQIPTGVTYASSKRLDSEEAQKATPIFCTMRKHIRALKCELGNPMHNRVKVMFRVNLEVEASVSKLDFFMETNSTNPEAATVGDNTQHLSVGVVIRATLSIISSSDPPELHYNASQYDPQNTEHDNKLGPQIIHKYNIKNEGPYNVEEGEVIVMWPYQNKNKENLMYMVEDPQYIGNVKCDVARNINPSNLVIQHLYYDMLSAERKVMGLTSYTVNNNYPSAETFNRQHSSGRQSGQSWNRNSGQSGSSQGFNQGSSQGFNQGSSHGSSQGSSQGSYSSRSWSSTWSGLADKEQQAIRQHLGKLYSEVQGYEYKEKGYNQYTNEEAKSYWNGLTSQEQDSVRNALFRIVKFEGGSSRNLQGNYNNGNGIVKVHNKTITYDENGIISETESSTEYTLGHEGEAGSSFNKYNQGSSSYNQGSGSYNQGSNSYNQGSSSYNQGSNSYNQGSGHHNQGSYEYNKYGAGGQGMSQGGSHQSGSQGSGQGFVHGSWATTETVNSDVMNAGSSTFRRQPGLTVVSDENDEIGGFGAYAAQGSNNEFKVGVADVTGAQAGSAQGSGGYRDSNSNYQGSSTNQYQSSGGSHQGSRTGGGYSYSESSSHGGGYSSSRREGTRRRREADQNLLAILDKCQDKYQCEVFRCTLGRLKKGDEVWIALRSRVNASVLNEISKDRPVILSTLATASVSKLPIQGDVEHREWHTAEAKTVITPQLEAMESGSIPLWVVVLAAVAGALLLLLLILLLYKCGFFKRNRPSDHTERQPLNGRDEHL